MSEGVVAGDENVGTGSGDDLNDVLSFGDGEIELLGSEDSRE